MVALVGRIQSLQMLRFAAALGVAVNHATVEFRQPQFAIGPAGVDIFFVLSGFVITHAAAAKPTNFLADRLTRVYPIYWAMAAPWLFFEILGGHAAFDRTFVTLTLWPALGSFVTPYLPAAWTLPYELLFYVCLWATLKGVKVRWLLYAYAGFVAASLVVNWPIVHFIGSAFILEFLAGAAISRLRGLGAIAGMACALAGVAAMIAVGSSATAGHFHFLPVDDLRRAVLWGVPAVAVVLGIAQLDLRSPAWKPLIFLGDASYSIYLSHPLVIVALSMAHMRSVPVAAALCVTVGVIVHLVLERPLLRDSRALVASLLRRRFRAAPEVITSQPG
jgi:exopolysaccharide production protein ExoZ